MARIVHIAPVVRSHGGMQSIVRRHRDLDRAAGHESLIMALFENMPAEDAGIGLGAAWWWTPGGLRKVFQHRVHASAKVALAVYHNAWGMPLLAPGDGAERRLAYLHTDWPGLAPAVKASSRWCDGFVCVSAALVESVQRIVPEYPRERVHRIRYPVSSPGHLNVESSSGDSRPFRIGYVGRLESRQKRVERLPVLVQAWPASAGPVEWHVLGDGPERGWLERSTAAAGNVRFHGWLSGQDYWRELAGLDAIVFLSDYEGTPIALLEAMSVGVAPVFPAIGGDGEELARELGASCIYPAGDLQAAARSLQALAAGDRRGWRGRAREIVAGHTAARYAEDFSRAIQETLDRPRCSAVATGRTRRWSDVLPMAVVHRYYEGALWR